LAARASVRGATYCLVFMVGRQSKAMACMGEMAGIGAEGEGERGDMAPIMTGKLIFWGKLALSRRQSYPALAFSTIRHPR
jgi:hypothetical protein